MRPPRPDDPLSTAADALDAFVAQQDVAVALTERERAAVLGAVGGETSAQIAERLGVRPPTVRTYLQRAYRKLSVSSLDELRDMLERAQMARAEAGDARSVGHAGQAQPAAFRDERLGGAPAVHGRDALRRSGFEAARAAALSVPAVACIAFPVFAGSFVPATIGWCIAGILALGCGGAGVVARRRSRERCPSSSRPGAAVALLLGWAFCASFTASIDRLFFAPFLLVLSIGLTVYLVCAARQRAAALGVVALILVCAGAFAAVTGRGYGAALYAACALFVSTGRTRYGASAVDASSFLWFALGIVAAALAVLMAPALVEALAWVQGASAGEVDGAVRGYAIGACSMAGALVFLNDCFARCAVPFDAGGVEGTERVRLYLLGRGLSEAEASVLLGIAEGASMVAIARRLSYSRSAVYGFRRTAYERLAVGDRAALIELIRRETGVGSVGVNR